VDHRAAEEATVGTIVVGVDGSRSSQRALDFALREAAIRGSTLKVVRAWSLWSAEVNGTDEEEQWPGGEGEGFDQIRRNAGPQLGEWVESSRGRTGVKDVGTELETRSGDAVPVLLEAAEKADLLIVGIRDRHDPTRLLLGSVGRELLKRAKCPLVLVPDDEHDEEER
jgi:nucleotide-binding universal stress UspA family protein